MLTFSLSKSDQTTTLAKKLKGEGGSIAIELATFNMSTGKQNLAESHLLMIGRTDSGEELDHEQIKDLFDLACIDASETQIAANLFKSELDALHAELGGEVSERNATYILQLEAIIDAERRDQQSTYFAKIKELEGKENSAKKQARKASDTIARLKFTQEARKLRSKIEELEDEYRKVRNRLRKQSDQQLMQVAEALEPKQTRKRLFTVNWRVIA